MPAPNSKNTPPTLAKASSEAEAEESAAFIPSLNVIEIYEC